MKAKEKLIIVNNSDLPFNVAMELVREVVNKGLVEKNNTQYTIKTWFTQDPLTDNKDYVVIGSKNHLSHKLTVENA